jgi:hypothetical protein
MKTEQRGGAQNDSRAQESAGIEERCAEAQEQTVSKRETRSSLTVSPQDQQLVPEE